MLKKLEVFFDLTCPFCYKGYGYITDLLKAFPSVEIVWRPIEAHPRTEEPFHRPCADLLVQAALFLRAKGCSERSFYERAYSSRFKEHKNIEDIDVIASCAPTEWAAQLTEALKARTFEKEQQDANDYAYVQNKIWAVPSYVCGMKRLDAEGGFGVSKSQIRSFLMEISS